MYRFYQVLSFAMAHSQTRISTQGLIAFRGFSPVQGGSLRCHRNRKHSSHQAGASGGHCRQYRYKKIDMHSLASVQPVNDHIPGRLFLILRSFFNFDNVENLFREGNDFLPGKRRNSPCKEF